MQRSTSDYSSKLANALFSLYLNGDEATNVSDVFRKNNNKKIFETQ